MDFQVTNIMETTCNSKKYNEPRGKIEPVAFGWIDIDICISTPTLFEINWIFFFFLIKWMWAFCTRLIWMSLGKKCVLAEVIIHLIKELVIKADHTSWNLMEMFFFWFCNLHRQIEHFQTLKNWYISPRNGWTLQRGSVACYGKMNHSTTLDFCWTININVCINITTRLTT